MSNEKENQEIIDRLFETEFLHTKSTRAYPIPILKRIFKYYLGDAQPTALKLESFVRSGHFSWLNYVTTKEGDEFWDRVIGAKDFDTYYGKFPVDWEPVRGERVHGDARDVHEYIFVSKIEGASYPYVVVQPDYEKEFVDGCPFHVELLRSISKRQRQQSLSDIGFDPSCLPAWYRNGWVAMDMDGCWFVYPSVPEIRILNEYWICYGGRMEIPAEYAPKNYHGDWKNSLFKLDQ